MDSLVQTPERRALRDTVHAFTTREVLPHLDGWEEAGEIPRTLHRQAAAAGLLGIGMDPSVGGSGGDALDSLVLTEQLLLSGGSGGLVAGLLTHAIALPHIVASGAGDQIDMVVRPVLAGEAIAALAVTEPDGGSDVAALRTTAARDGDDYVVNGSKTYITSGMRADFLTTVVRTGDAGHGGLSILVIPVASPGVTRRTLPKMGWRCSDTAELLFEEVELTADALLGTEGRGFYQIMDNFQNERLVIGAMAVGEAERALEITLDYVKSRKAFGATLWDKQAVRQKLAECASKCEAVKRLIHHTAWLDAHDNDCVKEVSMIKALAADMLQQTVWTCQQFHGGAGYMRGMEIERLYRDARVQAIGGGASEVMLEEVAKRM